MMIMMMMVRFVVCLKHGFVVICVDDARIWHRIVCRIRAATLRRVREQEYDQDDDYDCAGYD